MIIFKRMKKKIESDVHSFNDYNFTCHFCFQFDKKKTSLKFHYSSNDDFFPEEKKNYQRKRFKHSLG